MGEMIAEMLEIESSAEVESYARQWLKLYGDHEDAAEVAGKWLAANPCAETTAVAAGYLYSTVDTADLHAIVRAALSAPYSDELYDLIRMRLKRDPTDFMWCRVLPPYKVASEAIDRLVLQWLKLNEKNEQLLLVGSAAFTQSTEVLEAIFSWLETTGSTSPTFDMTLNSVYCSAASFHKPLVPRLIRFARAWLQANHPEQDKGGVFGTLIRASRSADDVADAKDWYKKHKMVPRSWRVLSAILQISRQDKIEVDPYAVAEAKILLSKLPPDEIPALTGALVDAHPDPETIALAKKCVQATNHTWILIILLRHAPDEELLRKGHAQLNELIGSEIEHEMLLVLLQKDTGNARVIELAENWLGKNATHKWADAIRAELASK